MSVALLAPTRFATLAKSLAVLALRGDDAILRGQLLNAFEAGLKTSTQVENLILARVHQWQKVNAAAYGARYAHNPEALADLDGNMGFTVELGQELSGPATLKALRALHYNCIEAEAQETPEMIAMEEAIEALKEHCIDLLPAYAQAEWAI